MGNRYGRITILKALQQIKNGDQLAISDLYNSLYQKLYNSIFFVVKRHEDAEELANDTFIKILGNLDSYQEGTNFEAWARRIAYNRAIDHYRTEMLKNKLHEQYSEKNKLEEEYQPNMEDIMISRETKAEKTSVINKLPYRYRQILQKKYLFDMTYVELAEDYGKPVEWIKALLARARSAASKQAA